MKVYFTASARGIPDYRDRYNLIFTTIKQLGHTNIDDLVVTLNGADDLYHQDSRESQVQLFQKTVQLIREADVVVLEVSTHSLSMGFVIHKALEIGKPVIALYAEDNTPYFASGIIDDKFQVVDYDAENIKQILSDSLEYAQEKNDTRFNFFVAPKHITYLDWIAKTKRIPRSVYLRKLIEKDKAANHRFLKAEGGTA